jgi:hypothetical protein
MPSCCKALGLRFIWSELNNVTKYNYQSFIVMFK